ncbi:MAG: hypothetical protein IPK72_21160 [Candidatus Eisenbacteria bacterium]|nr:hypothetical protein [Candidatus Eisenbacteria bacterium]
METLAQTKKSLTVLNTLSDEEIISLSTVKPFIHYFGNWSSIGATEFEIALRLMRTEFAVSTVVRENGLDFFLVKRSNAGPVQKQLVAQIIVESKYQLVK